MILPTIGRVVVYRSRTGHYCVPAIVTATQETLWREGVERGDVPDLDSSEHVHLAVLSPGGTGGVEAPEDPLRAVMLLGYVEHNVPFFDLTPVAVAPEPGPSEMEMLPRTWAWPPRR